MEKQTVIILCVIGAILVWVIGYFVMKFLKWKLKLNLNKTSFQKPEKITWTLDLEAKKNIEWNRLFVALVQYEKVRRRWSDWKTTTSRHEIWRFETDLEQAKEFSAWLKNTYTFEIPFPSEQNNNTDQFWDNELLNNIVKWANLISWNRMWTRTIEWKIEARLDAKGIDLTDSKRVYLNF